MEVNIKQAVKLFFTGSSLEYVFIEAVANSLDAEATEITIKIRIDEFGKKESLKVSIEDNGIGFTDSRFKKFNELLDVEEASHKGIGRLAYLSHFNTIDVVSVFDKKKRTFCFDENFKGASVVKDTTEKRGTLLTFSGYNKSRIASHDYLKPSALAKRIKEEFYPRLYMLKEQGVQVKIAIELFVENGDTNYDFVTDKKELVNTEFPVLLSEPLDSSILDLFKISEIKYSIIEKQLDKSIVTALCIDGRAYRQSIISDENIPLGYEMIFMLYSDLLEGQVDSSRQQLTIKDSELKPLIAIFRNKITEIIKREVPAVIERNEETKTELSNTFPHLQGYFDLNTVGFIKREETIRKAQEKFFKDQKEILESPDSLDEETYEKTLEISSRLLTEYVLYRQIIINRLKKVTKKDDENVIHQLIVPKRVFHKKDFINDIFSNNAWLLDDKFMTYNTILSDKVMSSIIKEITKGEVTSKDNSEPDIALIFSNNPESSEKVDVVIVELKKKGASLDENVKAITQLQTRATKLLHLYPSKIQRIWFYAIVDIDEEFQLYLENNDFISLYSVGSVFYREDPIKVSLTATTRIPVGLFLLNFDTFVEDANVRNSTFLNILKENFKSHKTKSSARQPGLDSETQGAGA